MGLMWTLSNLGFSTRFAMYSKVPNLHFFVLETSTSLRSLTIHLVQRYHIQIFRYGKHLEATCKEVFRVSKPGGIAKLTRFRADGAVEHADLWRAAAMLARDRCVETCKVKAHTGVSGNERADRLANEGRLEAVGADLGVEEIPKSGWDGEVPDDPPTDEEISEAVRHLRSYKAAGLDGITAEILKAALENESCQREFSECLRSVWSSGEVPQQWCDTPCVWIPKSSGGHRIVGLLALAWKVMARILLKRMEAFPLGPEQNGFSRGRSTLFPILTLRMLVDEARRKGRRLFACFLDLKQAYYSVDRQRLFDLLESRSTRCGSYAQPTRRNGRLSR